MALEHDLTKSQLFLDDTWIDDQTMLTRLWHQAEIFPEPVMRPEFPWEGTGLAMFGTVMKLEDGWRMYYTTVPGAGCGAMCVAQSDDGFHWTRPVLNMYEYGGSKANNIVLPQVRCVSVCHEPEDADAPFKTLVHRIPGRTGHPVYGLYLLVSKDGYRWTESADCVVPYPPDGPDGTAALAGADGMYLWGSKVDGKYICTYKVDRMIQGARRCVAMSEGTDFRSFSDSRVILRSDLIDSPQVQYHGMVGFPYGDMYLGVAERWFYSPNHVETLLVWSHDRKQWNRPVSRKPFIGPAYPWNQGWTTCSTGGPIRVGNQLRFYFGGQSGCNYHVKLNGPRQYGVVGLAQITIDRFASISAGFMEGRLVTKPMKWPGGDLMLNASTTRDLDGDPRVTMGGEMHVEVWDAEDQPVDGFAGDRRAPFSGNYPTRKHAGPAVLRWPGEKSLNDLAGHDIRLVFYLRDSHLYSFRSSG